MVVFLLCYFIVAFFASKVCCCMCVRASERTRRMFSETELNNFIFSLKQINYLLCPLAKGIFIHSIKKKEYVDVTILNLAEGAKL